MRKVLVGLGLLLAVFLSPHRVEAQAIVLPCVPSGNSCIPVSAANPLPTTGSGGTFPPTGCVTANGAIINNATPCSANFTSDGSGNTLTAGSLTLGAGPAILTSPASATLQHGAADVNGAPVAQTIKFQNALAGSATNTASPNTTIIGALGTGTGTNGNTIFQVGVKTSTGTAQATPTTALTITGETLAVTAAGAVTATGTVSGSSVTAGAAGTINWTGRAALTSPAAATTQLGFADAVGPTAQILQAQSATGTNISAVNLTINGSRSTGSGTSGDVIFQTGGTGAGSGTQNSFVTALTLKGATQVVLLPAITSDATHTDTTVCQDTTTHGLYAGSGTAGICLGNVSSIRFKDAWAPLDDGLSVVLALNPGTWRYKPGTADNGARLQVGFLAEDYARVLPDWTRYDEQNQPNGVDLLAVLPQVVRAIQQLKADNDGLRAELDAIKRRLN